MILNLNLVGNCFIHDMNEWINDTQINKVNKTECTVFKYLERL